MGSPSAAERPASAPSRLKLTIGPGPASGDSKLNMLRPHGPEKSGMAAAFCAFAVGASSTRKASKDFFIAALSGSEIRFLGLRNRPGCRFVVEKIGGVLGTDQFRDCVTF